MASDQQLTPAKFLLIIGSLKILLLLSIFLGLSIGSVDVSFDQLIRSFFGGDVDQGIKSIIIDIRLPRVLLAVTVGGGLAISGAVFQALLMNPLAEPYILGISSGGTFGAILSLVLGLAFFYTQIFAFAGAMLVVFLVFYLGQRFGELEPNILLLTGVVIGAFFSALILLMLTILEDSLRTAVFWLIGNLSFSGMNEVLIVLPIVLIGSVVLFFFSQKYNTLALGSKTAQQLGINAPFVKNFSYIIASIIVGAAVSVSGIIGFVGLLVPHIVRLIFGIDNRIVIPASFLLGASYLILADLFARSLMAPSELPVGAITALIGAPVFIYLLRKRFSLFN
ncbi:MAG: iron ABC transporter permease [Melioribacteraceae bacterium]|jgi:iron complex transport system permease protein|nr:iron ABC transporter permease [Melioribacteraceae bacterium]RJP60828.1 MAG: iron ABC transporter permease [Ignavibacteriales bacterium]WKZ68758.1 MAG: iron ABC transporter permease [Melioribacteraceae bacterium]